MYDMRELLDKRRNLRRAHLTILLLALTAFTHCGDEAGNGEFDVLDMTPDATDLSEESRAYETPTQDAISGDIVSSVVCPVVAYSECGGDLLGRWNVLGLCPEDGVTV